jgi:hypothetical protein
MRPAGTGWITELLRIDWHSGNCGRVFARGGGLKGSRKSGQCGQGLMKLADDGIMKHSRRGRQRLAQHESVATLVLADGNQGLRNGPRGASRTAQRI